MIAPPPDKLVSGKGESRLSLVLWTFWIYSFFGYLLERGYAAATHAERQARKCFWLLPLCPVYGLGALAVLALPAAVRAHPLLLLPAAGAACTAVEYLTSIFYEKVFRVAFWDYSHLPCSLGGRVCLRFTLYWGALSLPALYIIHPAAAWLAAQLPPWALPPAALVLGADTLLTALVLRRTGDTDSLRWYARLPRRRAA